MTQQGIAGRNRRFPPYLTLWTFLLQVLSPNGSCREALSRLPLWMIAKGQTPCSPHTGSYCKARQRLPEGVVCKVFIFPCLQRLFSIEIRIHGPKHLFACILFDSRMPQRLKQEGKLRRVVGR